MQGRGVSVGPARRDTRAWGSGVRAGRTRLGAATLTAPRCRVQNDVGALASVLGEDQAGWPQRQEAEAGPGRLSGPGRNSVPLPSFLPLTGLACLQQSEQAELLQGSLGSGHSSPCSWGN